MNGLVQVSESCDCSVGFVAEDFGFAALNQAQAMGDCAELSRIGRSVCWINLDGPRFAQMQRLRAILRECLDW